MEATKLSADAQAWTFNIDLTSGTKLISGGATFILNENGSGNFSGTMQFNYPKGDSNSTPAQAAWSETAFDVENFTYDAEEKSFSFDVPDAVPAFANNFNEETGTPLREAGTGPVVPAPYQFKFTGDWDGSSDEITNGQAWVPEGWLIDCPGTTIEVRSPVPETPKDDDDTGGGDPPNSTWTSDGG
jgi:hypothetical protein